MDSLLNKYRNVIQNLPDNCIDEKLIMDRDGKLSIYYAPFEYINPNAKVVIVGITPGRTQMTNALREAQNQLKAGADSHTVLRQAKLTGAFSGTLRNNLINLLDHIGINQWLNIETTGLLFGSMAHLAQTASVLSYPVFVDGKDYNGTPNMLKQPLLKRYLHDHFGNQARELNKAVFIPLGDKTKEALSFLSAEGFIDKDRILGDLPHPSGANAERIAYFLGRKNKDSLSAKTNPEKIDMAKNTLIKQLSIIKGN
ncbi:hypothetical protein A1359_20410 [Methylomonas lenta]|uniref:Uracil-DNA glycosylase-like domain-containing protein n=1 Tax=Methylomonas lenta TaxID=980561 RepID=A0A177NSK5_9GAMM|nr:hypothetical protein [Methylomonas lenta]OAI20852.1 hypothetical protein A1359_20410 [Methylomonas lenta]